MTNIDIIEKYRLPNPALLTDEEVQMIHNTFLDVLNYRKHMKVEKEKQEIICQMNDLLHKFQNIRNSELNDSNDNDHHENELCAYVQEKYADDSYYEVGDYNIPVYGFALDHDGDMMIVLDKEYCIEGREN